MNCVCTVRSYSGCWPLKHSFPVFVSPLYTFIVSSAMCDSKRKATVNELALLFDAYWWRWWSLGGHISGKTFLHIQKAWLAFANLGHLWRQWHSLIDQKSNGHNSSNKIGTAVRLRSVSVEGGPSVCERCCLLGVNRTWWENLLFTSEVKYKILDLMVQSLAAEFE